MGVVDVALQLVQLVEVSPRQVLQVASQLEQVS